MCTTLGLALGVDWRRACCISIFFLGMFLSKGESAIFFWSVGVERKVGLRKKVSEK